MGWLQSADYIIGASAVSIGFAGCFLYSFNIPPVTSLIVLVGVVLLVILMLNIRGIMEAAGANNVLVLLKVFALIIFVAVGGQLPPHIRRFRQLPAVLSHGDCRHPA